MKQISINQRKSKIGRKLFVVAVTLCLLVTCAPTTGGVAFAGEIETTEATLSQGNNVADLQESKTGYKPVEARRYSENEIQTASFDQAYAELALLNAVNAIDASPIADIGNESRYCRQQLENTNSNLIDIYDVIRNGINGYEGEIQIENIPSEGNQYTSEEVWQAYTLVKEDYPEFFWLGNGYNYSPYFIENGEKVEYEEGSDQTEYVETIAPEYLFDDIDAAVAAQEELTMAVDQALSVLKGYDDFADYNDYDKELWVHDFIAKNTVYDEAADGANEGSDDYNRQTAYGALVEGKAVCEGYTRAFQLMLSELGIESCTITGSSDGTNINHIWNAVKIEEDWYQVDLTWDDRGSEDYEISYRWFNETTTIMKKDHFLMDEANFVTIPECEGTDWWYYMVNLDKIVITVPKEEDEIDTLAWEIADQINDYGYARLYALDNSGDIGNLYMYKSGDSFELGMLGKAVLAHLYIKGDLWYGGWSCGPEGAEMILYMYPDEETGEIYAADVWDMIRQDDKKDNVVIRAYPEGTSGDVIASIIKKEMGKGENMDCECVCEATVIGLDEMDDSYDLYEPMFLFEAIPLGDYDVAIYKPGYPITIYDLTVEVGGIPYSRALQSGSWWINSFGDVDDSWDVDMADALMLKRHIAGWGGAYDKIDTLTADINGNGEITLDDLMLLEKHIAGWTKYADLSLYWKAS